MFIFPGVLSSGLVEAVNLSVIMAISSETSLTHVYVILAGQENLVAQNVASMEMSILMKNFKWIAVNVILPGRDLCVIYLVAQGNRKTALDMGTVIREPVHVTALMAGQATLISR